MTERAPLIIVVMGVSGSGKSTLGRLLAERLHARFCEGDELHDAANIAKMQRGVPLQDADRVTWLNAIAEQIASWRAANVDGVITCSALKRRYRATILPDPRVAQLVYLHGDRALISARLAARTGHFMPGTLLQSQFDALEEPVPEEHALVVPIGPPAPQLVATIVARLPARAGTEHRPR